MSPAPPPHPWTRHSHVQAAGGWAGPLWRELGQQHEAASGWLLGLALLKARAVNSALLKMSNKGEKERKEKGEWGEPRVGVGEARLREQVGTI